MMISEQKNGETWRVYTKRLAKENRCSRRRILRYLKRSARNT